MRPSPALIAVSAVLAAGLLATGCRGGDADDAAVTTVATSADTTSTTIDPTRPQTATGANGNPRDERIGPPANNRPSDGTLAEGQCFNEILVTPPPPEVDGPTGTDAAAASTTPTAAAPTATAPATTAAGTATSGATTTQPEAEPTAVLHQLIVVPDCALPHDGEVFAVLTLEEPAAAAFPGETAMQRRAAGLCLERFEPFVGLEYATSRLRIAVLRPTESTWTDNERTDRTVVCSVYDEALRPLTGSARLSGR